MSVSSCVVALVVALALVSRGSTQNVCTSATSGRNDGTPVQLDKVIMNSGVPSYDVSLPANPCPKGTLVGSLTTGCDIDLAPSVSYVVPVQKSRVVRSSYRGEGYIQVIAYCV